MIQTIGFQKAGEESVGGWSPNYSLSQDPTGSKKMVFVRLLQSEVFLIEFVEATGKRWSYAGTKVRVKLHLVWNKRTSRLLNLYRTGSSTVWRTNSIVFWLLVSV